MSHIDTGTKTTDGTPAPLWRTRLLDAGSCSFTHPAVRGNHYSFAPKIHAIMLWLKLIHVSKEGPVYNEFSFAHITLGWFVGTKAISSLPQSQFMRSWQTVYFLSLNAFGPTFDISVTYATLAQVSSNINNERKQLHVIHCSHIWPWIL